MMSSVEVHRTAKKGDEKLEKFRISLKAALTNTDKSRAELAEIFGVDVSTITNWCSGIGSPSVAQLRRISELSGIPMDFIFLPKESI
jgi:transcriptional regulator with XRE-family HTH domain